jgi:hypothetical protein
MGVAVTAMEMGAGMYSAPEAVLGVSLAVTLLRQRPFGARCSVALQRGGV